MDTAALRSIWLGSLSLVVLAACGERAALPASHRRMLEALDEIAARAPEENPFFGDGPARRLRERLSALTAEAPLAERWLLLSQLGEAQLNLGREAEAIESMTEALGLLERTKDISPDQALALLLRLGVAHLRMGETRNCCQRNTPDSCLLPIRGRGIHTVTEPSRQAAEYFDRVLRFSRPESDVHLAARWLLNIAYMTIGGYPDDVPRRWLIPPATLESDEAFPRFPNVAHAVGLDTLNCAGAAIADDFDGDDQIDVIVSNMDPAGQLRFFHNQVDGAFVERTREAGLAGIRGGLNGVQADYDNDGDADVLILRGAWLGPAGRHPKSLLRNNGDGTFTDVTFDAGLAEPRYPTQTGAWADYDHDGDLDLYVGNEQVGEVIAPCQLFRNEGDGTFVDVAPQAGVTNDRFTKAVVWGDYDEDRFPDLYLSNLRGSNRLYRNLGNGSFTDVAPELGVTEPQASFPAWFWDFDNDGHLDIFVSAYQASIAVLAAHLLGQPLDVELARLYRGDGRGGFEDVAASRNLTDPVSPMGSNFGDLDNDGYLDFYLGTGFPDYREVMPNVMYHNLGGRSFADVSAVGGFAHLQKGHGVAFADLDNDGDQDVFEEMGGAFPGDAFTNVLYENPGFGNRWISLKLVGARSNRSAIGARIRVEVLALGERRTVYKHVNSGGSFGANPLRQAIGLGTAERIERLEVYWPATDLTQVFLEVPLDRHLQITEGEDQVVILPLTAFRLGRPGST